MTADGAGRSGPQGDVTIVSGRGFCLSTGSGQIRPGPYGDGVFLEDTRILSCLLLTLDGQEPHALGNHPLGPGAAGFSACAHVDGETDPTLLIERRRSVVGGWHEQVQVTSHRLEPVAVRVELEVGADFAYIFDVKHGRQPPVSRGVLGDQGVGFTSEDGVETSSLVLDPQPARLVDGVMSWDVLLPARGTWVLSMGLVGAHGPEPTTEALSSPRSLRHASGSLAHLRVTCSDVRFEELLRQSTADLESLLIRDGDDRYFAAGSPWYLTLFGRDSLWSAMMALPLGVDVAGETLRLLARNQGTRHDEVTEEAPGKILHEVRSGSRVDRGDLPPRYYGTIDATPLFVVALERAWRWGLHGDLVEELLPNVERALAWMRDDGDPDGTGLLRYEAVGDRRLANQGWKDSHDGVGFTDGRLARPPIALCEVQGYAHRAALAGAALLDHHDRPGGDEWRVWAGRLRERFQAEFWVDGDDGGFPALAVDGDGLQVDSVTSNAGHLLGTGILEPWQEARVAARLGEPDMDAGWGLRTLSSTAARFNPLSYHGGSIWPHDTAIAIDGLARVGAGATAGQLLHGLVAAGDHFGHRLPELFGGSQRTDRSRPLPYPSACSPQAWAAAAPLHVMCAVLGLDPDVPNGRLHLRPMRPHPFGRLVVEGIPLAGGTLGLVIEDGRIHVLECTAGIEVVAPDE